MAPFSGLLLLLLWQEPGVPGVGGMELVSSSPPAGTITTEGSPLTLSCSSSSPWFFCLWHSPVGDKQCAIQENTTRSVCGSGSGATLHSSISTSSCSLSLEKVSREDHGHWMCLLNDITEFDTVKSRVRVEVGVPSTASWGPAQGLERRGPTPGMERGGPTSVNEPGGSVQGLEGGGPDPELRGAVLSLVEGEQRELLCEGRGGYPAPSFMWGAASPWEGGREGRWRRGKSMAERSVELELYQEEGGDILTNTTTKVELSQSSGHLYSGQQGLYYTARLQDHGGNITCTVLQLDRLGSVLYSSTITLQLEVSELVIYYEGSGVLEERIGIISGIILAIIFIILIFILTALLLTRRRKKVPKYTQVEGDSKGSDEHLTPIWKTGKRGKVAMVSGEREFSSGYHEDTLQLVQGSSGYRRIPQARVGCHCQGPQDKCDTKLEAMVTGTEDILNISLESGESSTQHSHTGQHSLSRPTTRTTKTISSGSDSSRSSIATDRSMRDGGAGGEHTYINFQPQILTSELERQAPALSPSSCALSPLDISRQPSDRSRVDSRASSRLHETHFGDSVHSLPCTVVHSPVGRGEGEEQGREPRLTPFPGRGEGEEPLVTPVQGGGPHSYLARQRLLPLGSNRPLHRLPLVQIRPGNTIFDCELGCFITVEEYQQRRSREKLNVHKENL